MGLTSDRNDPRLTHGVDESAVPQAEMYLVLSAEDRAKGFVRPVLNSYLHDKALGGCGAVTTMGRELAETYARSPRFYGATYCARCAMHRPVGMAGEFYWLGTEHATWELNGDTTSSEDCITANRLRVGT